ncbi:MAG TPA: MerR family transcriptional regulator [Pseudogracilibacillus sp.]|nr:MerR family transcriptional regulator [Pseudogracilibacillus sp.]
MTWLRIGELAKKCEIPTGRVRYYERMGLIPEPERTESDYRLYSVETSDRILLIQRMKSLGFTLREIRTLLDIMNGEKGDNRDIQQFTNNKLDEVQRKMADLKKIQTLLLDLQQRCPGQGDLDQCPVIDFVIPTQSKEEKLMKAENTHIFKVKGMHCEGCEERVKNALIQVPGVADVKADHTEGKVELVLSGDVSEKNLSKKIKSLGFKVSGSGQ